MTIIADIVDEFPDKITLKDVPFNLKELILTLPGIRWDKAHSVWRTPLAWTSYLAVNSTLKDRVSVGDKLAAWRDHEVETRINPSLALREALDAPGLEGLFPHQKAGVAFLKTAKRALCADDMGLGKSRQAVATIMAHYQDGVDPFPALIVCPNSTKNGWEREIEEVWPGLTVTVVKGSVTQRRKQLQTPSHIYILNWESVRSHSRLAHFGSVAFKKCVECGGNDEKVTTNSCQTHVKELNEIDFKSVIVDEAHRMADPKSQQTRAIKAATGDADIRIAMTGTPIANSPEDLWSILNWISPEEWPGKSKYVERMLEVSYDMFGYTHVSGVKLSMRDEFFAALDPRMRRMPKDLVLKNLPPVVRIRKDVEMSPKQKKAYEQMRDQMIAEIDGEVVVTTSPMHRSMRMLQFASSYAELEVVEEWSAEEQDMVFKTKVLLSNPSSKIDAFMSDLKDYGDKQLVVFAPSRQLIELLSEKMTKDGHRHGLITGAIDIDERQIYMDQFQNGELKYMLCTTGAGGTGITLTAADTVVFLSRPWSNVESSQAEARVRRIGSEIHESITVVDYVSTGTLDEVVIESLENKTNLLQEILRDEQLLKKILQDEKPEPKTKKKGKSE